MTKRKKKKSKLAKAVKDWTAAAATGLGQRFCKDGIGKYERWFEQAQPNQVTTGEFLRPQEYPLDTNERKASDKALCGELKDRFAEDVCKGAGAADVDFQDPHWGHTTGLLVGELEIQAPEAPLNIGLFERNETYQVIARPNYLYDDEPLIAISRFALKIKYDQDVPNQYSASGSAKEIDLLFSEGLPFHKGTDGKGFFFRDAQQLMLAHHLKPGGAKALKLLANKSNGRVARKWKELLDSSTDELYEASQVRLGWSAKHYYSAGPYALGDYAMKFALKPLQTHDLGREIDVREENPAPELKRQFWPPDQAERPLEERRLQFELNIQIATDDCIPEPGEGDPGKDVMIAEYTDLVWNEDATPFRKVGTLTLRAAMPGELPEKPHTLAFNAWNTREDMLPLGQLFRVRKYVHSHHRKVRLEDSFGCPVTGSGKQ